MMCSVPSIVALSSGNLISCWEHHWEWAAGNPHRIVLFTETYTTRVRSGKRIRSFSFQFVSVFFYETKQLFAMVIHCSANTARPLHRDGPTGRTKANGVIVMWVRWQKSTLCSLMMMPVPLQFVIYTELSCPSEQLLLPKR